MNEADLAVLDEILSPELAYHSGTLPAMTAGEVADGAWSDSRPAFPMSSTPSSRPSAGDNVVTLIWSAQGTHSGEFQGYAPRASARHGRGINVYRFECGRVVEVWAEVDALGRLRQMGVVGRQPHSGR